MPYDLMDLGFDDMRKRLLGAGLDENDAEMGTLAMTPKLYRDRQERLNGLSNFAFTGQAPGQGQQEIDLSFGYNPKPSETAQIPNPVADLWKQQAQKPAQGTAFPEPAVELGDEARQAFEANPEYQAPAWEQAGAAPFKAPAPAVFQPGQAPSGGFQKTFTQAPEATGAAKYSSPGNLADAIAAAAWKARTGGRTEDYYADKGLNQAAGPNDLGNLRMKAAMGDTQAAKKLEYLARNPGFGAAMYGGLAHERAASAEDREARAFEMALEQKRHQMLGQDRGFYEGQRQFDARQGLAQQQHELAKQQAQDEADYKRGLITNAELALRTAQRKQAADEMRENRRFEMEANDPARGLDQLILDAMKRIQSGQGTPADYQVAKMEMPDVADFDRFASMATNYGAEKAAEMINARRASEGKAPLKFPGGDVKTLAEKNMEGQKLRAAQAEYRNAVNTARDPTSAAQEISLRTGVPAEQLGTAAPGMEAGDIGAALSRFGYQNVDQAFQAAGKRAFQRNPQLMEQLKDIAGFGDPRGNPRAMAIIKQAVQQELVRSRMPLAFAQQVAANGTF